MAFRQRVYQFRHAVMVSNQKKFYARGKMEQAVCGDWFLDCVLRIADFRIPD